MFLKLIKQVLAISKRTEFLISILGKTDASDVIECLGIDKTFSSFFGATSVGLLSTLHCTID